MVWLIAGGALLPATMASPTAAMTAPGLAQQLLSPHLLATTGPSPIANGFLPAGLVPAQHHHNPAAVAAAAAAARLPITPGRHAPRATRHASRLIACGAATASLLLLLLPLLSNYRLHSMGTC